MPNHAVYGRSARSSVQLVHQLGGTSHGRGLCEAGGLLVCFLLCGAGLSTPHHKRGVEISNRLYVTANFRPLRYAVLRPICEISLMAHVHGIAPGEDRALAEIKTLPFSRHGPQHT
jgi:hypothetical protein